MLQGGVNFNLLIVLVYVSVCFGATIIEVVWACIYMLF